MNINLVTLTYLKCTLHSDPSYLNMQEYRHRCNLLNSKHVYLLRIKDHDIPVRRIRHGTLNIPSEINTFIGILFFFRIILK